MPNKTMPPQGRERMHRGTEASASPEDSAEQAQLHQGRVQERTGGLVSLALDCCRAIVASAGRFSVHPRGGFGGRPLHPFIA